MEHIRDEADEYLKSLERVKETDLVNGPASLSNDLADDEYSTSRNYKPYSSSYSHPHTEQTQYDTISVTKGRTKVPRLFSQGKISNSNKKEPSSTRKSVSSLQRLRQWDSQ